MRAVKSRNAVRLTFSLPEGRILRQILHQIMVNYQVKPEELDAKTASIWYSTQGCKRAKMSAEDTRDWVQNLHQYKSANVQHLGKWFRRLSVPTEGHCQLSIKLEEAPVLLTALNDHRLLVAARHDIGQKEMDARSLSAFNALQPEQQTAVSEIYFLACIIEQILRFLPGNPGDWMESLG